MTPRPPIKATIEWDEETTWTVRCGDRYESHLDSGEVLWAIVHILKREPAPFLRTAEEHAKWNFKYGPKSEDPP